MSNSFVYNNKRYDLPEGFDNIRLSETSGSLPLISHNN